MAVQFATPADADVSKLAAQEWAYVIVGGGTAGCLLANRLAARCTKGQSVLILEAGKSHVGNINAIVPLGGIQLAMGEANWNFPIVPQKALNGKKMVYNRGRILGGSSLLNYQAYTRGPAVDYDYVAEQLGDLSWKWENVLPAYKELEKWDPSVPEGMEAYANWDPSAHGPTGQGSLGVSFNTCWGAETDTFIEACKSLGHKVPKDLNGGDCMGVSVNQFTVMDGQRTSAGSAFLAPDTTDREHLTIATGVLADRIILDDSKRAVGVDVVGHDGQTARIRASSEIILACGTISTPPLLQRSGLGPRDVLEPLGIPVIEDLPGVGRGLMDHVALPVVWRVRKDIPTADDLRTDPEKLQAALMQYQKDRTGPMAAVASGPILFMRFEDFENFPEYKQLDEKTKAFFAEEKRPHTEILTVNFCNDGRGSFPPEGGHITTLTFLQNCLSQGSVEITSKDPASNPTIDFKMLEHPMDRRMAIESVRAMLRIGTADPYTSQSIWSLFSGPAGGSLQENGKTPEKISDEAIWEFLQETAERAPHAVGTARMGRDWNDKDAVVDTKYRVKGTQGLRIADLSVFPFLINAHTQALAYLIGEKAAQAILEDQK